MRSPRCRRIAGTGSATTTRTNRRRIESSKWGGFLADHPFDPGHYGMPPATLASIDPLQLLTLEAVRAALADAFYLDRPFDRDKASVVLGVGGGSGDLGQRYGLRAALPQFFNPVPSEVMDQLPAWTEDSFAGILLNVAAGRVANRFDFHGVNFIVDAACASSLAACYLAVNELQAGNSDLMIVGGVNTVQSPRSASCASVRRRRSHRTASAARSTPRPTGSRSAKVLRLSCSNAWPMPNATVTGSMPSSRALPVPATVAARG